jgi:hypothetical protein
LAAGSPVAGGAPRKALPEKSDAAEATTDRPSTSSSAPGLMPASVFKRRIIGVTRARALREKSPGTLIMVGMVLLAVVEDSGPVRLVSQ